MSDAEKNAYRPADIRKLPRERVKSIVLQHTNDFVELIFPGQKTRPDRKTNAGKGYDKPSVRKLTPEQAKLLLIGHASAGDHGAKDLLELMLETDQRVEGSVVSREKAGGRG